MQFTLQPSLLGPLLGVQPERSPLVEDVIGKLDDKERTPAMRLLGQAPPREGPCEITTTCSVEAAGNSVGQGEGGESRLPVARTCQASMPI